MAPTEHLEHLPRRRALLAAGVGLPLASSALVACSDGGGPGPETEPDLRAEAPRAEPGPAQGAGQSVVPFTAQLLAGLDRDPVNLVCSPLSAQTALTMVGLGAAGDTRAQMEEVLGGSVDELAQGANTLASVLAGVGETEGESKSEDAPEPPLASLVNGTWVQEGLDVEDEFLDGLATHFDSGLFTADFVDPAEREEARERINGWVEESTNDLIEELIPEGKLSADSRLVLVSALHLKASWPMPLEKSGGRFTRADGEELSVEMLNTTTSAWYEDELCRATTLDTFGGDLALAVIEPVGSIDEVLDAWEAASADPQAGLAALLTGLEESGESVQLTLPGFDITWDGDLKPPLLELGMTDAFGGDADFSGITGSADLFIEFVLQKAVITVDEYGMEAAAATAVGMTEAMAPQMQHQLMLDAPFLFVAYETTTLAPLVLGWIGDPTAE